MSADRASAGRDTAEIIRESLGGGGIWCQLLRPEAAAALAGRPALFLDRDGVLVEEVGYLHRPEDLRMVPGAAELVAAANRRRCPVVLVTNQSGIGRGLYGWPDFAATQARLVAELAEVGAALDMVLACPFHRDGRPPYRQAGHPCRKPRPGMLLRAADALGLDLAGSWIVGDRAADLEAGRAAGLAGGLLLAAEAREADGLRAARPAGQGFQVRSAETLDAALSLPLFDDPPPLG